MKTRRSILAIVGLSLIAVVPAQEDRSGGGQQPLDLDLVEKTERKLVQLDVSVRPRKKYADEPFPVLAVDDFELIIAGERIDLRYVDRLCRAVPAARPEPAMEPEETVEAARPAEPLVAEEPPVARSRGTFLFYFEHKHLTIEGQANALEMVERLIPELVVDGNRGMVVSSGRRLLQSDLTADPQVLVDFVGSVRDNTQQWSEAMYAEQETDRLIEILDRRDNGDEGQALNLAGHYLREEIMTTNKRLRRFAATLGALADLDPPKAVLYFADIIRQKPGEHYLQMFGTNVRRQGSSTKFQTSNMEASAFMAAHAFDKVTEQAGAHGIRLYTVQARGMQTEGLGVRQGGLNTRADRVPNTRIREAEMTLASFALETGGETFRGGTDGKTLADITSKIQTDLSCFYLLSFYPDELGLDQKLPVRVRFNQDSERYDMLQERYEVRSRGQMVVQSAGARKQSLLLAAHVAEGAVDAESGRGVLIPLAYRDGHYRALVQFMVLNPGLPEELRSAVAWELGMTHVAKEKVRHQTSRRIEIDDPQVPVVLEAEWEFEPGSSEIVSVAFEDRFGQLVTLDLDPEWPDPNAGKAVVTSLAVVQPMEGVFVRESDDEESPRRLNGTLGIGEGFARHDRPTYVVGLVCRSKGNKKDLWIDRELVGQAPVDFELQRWEYDGERCVQIRDLIRQGVMGVTEWGEFTYRIAVHEDEDLLAEPLARAEREFVVVDPEVSVEAINREPQPKPSDKLDPLQVLPGLQ